MLRNAQTGGWRPGEDGSVIYPAAPAAALAPSSRVAPLGTWRRTLGRAVRRAESGDRQSTDSGQGRAHGTPPWSAAQTDGETIGRALIQPSALEPVIAALRSYYRAQPIGAVFQALSITRR